MHPKRRTGPPANKPAGPAYRQLWRVVDGMVANALMAHPEYLAVGISEGTVRRSIVKRVTGGVLGYAAQKPREAGRR